LQALITVAAFLVTLGVLVSFHEFGHFLAARCCGVRVLRFAVGFGKPLFTYHAKNKTEWVLASIPLGGYVKLLDGRDREQVISPQDQARAFDSKKLWQRSLIVAAGPFANFFLAVILFALIYVSGVPQLPAVLDTPPEHSMAAKLGLAQGDRVVGWQDLSSNEMASVGNEFEIVRSWNSLRWNLFDAVTAQRGFVLELQGLSGGRFIKIFPTQDLPEITPNSDPMQALGIRPTVTPPSSWQELQVGPLDALLYASHRVWLITKISVRLMAGIFTGNTSIKQLGGPLSIADMAGKSAQVGWQPFFAFLAMISISLGVLNLLPIPLLDGGHLMYYSVELTTGVPVSEKVAEWGQKLGILVLGCLMVFALFNDLNRLVSG
jgi:regulator of sigma E protease